VKKSETREVEKNGEYSEVILGKWLGNMADIIYPNKAYMQTFNFKI
jgi:hypothetical protein